MATTARHALNRCTRKFSCTLRWKSTAHHFSAPAVQTAMQWTPIARITLILCLPGLAPHSFGQKVTFGAITGAQLTDDFRSLSCPDLGVTPNALVAGCPNIRGGSFTVANASRGFIIGPKVNIQFSSSWSIEIDALHREIRSDNSRTFLFCPPQELPECTTVVPFTYSFAATEFTWEFPVLGRYQTHGRKLNPFLEGGPSFRPAENRELYGVTAGAGLQMRLRNLRLFPSLRYTHWVNNGKYVGLNQDQFQFVVGIDGNESPEPVSAFGHKVSLGIVAGLALTDGLQTRSESFTNVLEIDPVTRLLTPVDGTATDNENRSSPVVGIVTEIALPKRLSLEVGALYRPIRAKDTREFSNGTSRENQFTVLTWEFPILAKYKVPLRKATPFVEVGPSIRASGNLNGAHPSRFGITAGIGMELPARRLTLVPTLRFTRWATDAVSGTRTHSNQAELVLGVRF